MDIKLAFLGESGAGKTCLLSSFYGRLAEGSFNEKLGYRLAAIDTAQDVELTSKFNGILSTGHAKSTPNFKTYDFNFKLASLGSTPLKIRWFDYDGALWRSNLTTAARKEDIQELTKLLESQVAFVLVDGDQYCRYRKSYAKNFLGLFQRQLERHLEYMKEHGLPLKEYPKDWIITLTKADLYTELASAEQFAEQLNSDGASELKLLWDTIKQITGETGEEPTFKYLILSAFSYKNQQEIDRDQEIGLRQIIPISLVAIVHRVCQEIQESLDMFQKLPFLKHLPPPIRNLLETLGKLIQQVIPEEPDPLELILRLVEFVVENLLLGQCYLPNSERFVKNSRELGSVNLQEKPSNSFRKRDKKLSRIRM